MYLGKKLMPKPSLGGGGAKALLRCSLEECSDMKHCQETGILDV